MNPKLNFTNKKFHSLLATATFSVAMECLILLSDTIVVGQLIGDDGISGINMVTPIFSIVAFLGMLISMGTVYRYTHETGKFNQERADRLAGQGLILAVLSGLILFVLVFFGENLYFSFMGVTGQKLTWAVEYYQYFRFTVLIYPLYCFLAEIVYADGDELACILSYVAQIGGNIILSIIFVIVMKTTAGASLGTLIGTILSILVTLTHFFKKKNSLHFVPHFKIKDIIEVITYSCVDAGLYLFWGLLGIVMNKIIVAKFGQNNLPIVSVVTSLIELTILFDGVASAVIPLFNQYNGEKNHKGIKNLMCTATRTSVIEGLLFTAVIEIGAPLLPMLFDVADPRLVALSVTAIRIYCPTAVFTSLLFLYTSYYLMQEHIAVAFLVIALKDLCIPIALGFALSCFMGMNGLWVGFMLSPLLTLVLGLLISCRLYGRENTPLLIGHDTAPTYIYNIEVTKEQIIALRNQAENDLKTNNISPGTINRIMLLIEELYMAILEHNKGKKSVLSECSIIIHDDVQLITKDNGDVFDITNDDNTSESIGTYVVSSLIRSVPGSQHMLTSSFNRNAFHFPK